VVDVCEPTSLYPSPTSPTNFFSSPAVSRPLLAALRCRPPPVGPAGTRPPRCYLRPLVFLGRRATLMVDFQRVFSRGTEFRPALGWRPALAVLECRVVLCRAGGSLRCAGFASRSVFSSRRIDWKVAVVGGGAYGEFLRS
jgi:hypothetical protein